MAINLRCLERTLLDLVFPPRCVDCGRYEEGYICSKCRAGISFITSPVCDSCGRPVSDPGLCAACRDSRLSVEGLRSAVLFEGPARKAIHAFKYDGLTSLSESLGELLIDGWKRFQIPVDMIIPIPLHPKRIRQRGYNQSALLARELGRYTGLKVFEDVLMRVRETLPQVDLDAQQRWENVNEAFQCRAAGQARGRAILLIDDVCTTGATVNACAEALRPHKPASIWALTLARA